MSNLAIIPARGGSKRIPRKNIKNFLGIPIITYSIKAVIESELFDEVMVSTDDEEIARIALDNGAKVPFLRSKETANDFATTTDVLKEVIQKYRDEEVFFEYACCIYATAPFITKEKIKESFDLLKKEKLDNVIPVIPFSFPIQRSVRKVGSRIEFNYPEYISTRSQDLEKAYHDVGQFYFFNVESLLSKGTLWTDNTGGLVLSELEAQDIDSEEDWKLAELKYKLMKGI